MAGVRNVRMSPVTAIELNKDEQSRPARNRIADDLEASLYRLSNQGPSDESLVEVILDDQWSHLRSMEEMRLIKELEELASLYPQLWENALRDENPLNSDHSINSSVYKEVNNDLFRVSRIPEHLNNWYERVVSERNENAELLKSLHSRRSALREERKNVNALVSMIVQTFDECRRDNTAANTISTSDDVATDGDDDAAALLVMALTAATANRPGTSKRSG